MAQVTDLECRMSVNILKGSQNVWYSLLVFVAVGLIVAYLVLRICYLKHRKDKKINAGKMGVVNVLQGLGRNNLRDLGKAPLK